MLPPRLLLVTPSLHTPLRQSHLFLVGCCVGICLVSLFHLPYQMRRPRPTLRSLTSVPPLQHLICRESQLLVDCCVSLLIGNHLRPRPYLPLYFLMGLALAPQTKEPTMVLPNPIAHALSQLMGSSGAMSCRHRCSTHGERGQSRWRVGPWRLILVLCIVLCLCAVVCTFSYL